MVCVVQSLLSMYGYYERTVTNIFRTQSTLTYYSGTNLISCSSFLPSYIYHTYNGITGYL